VTKVTVWYFALTELYGLKLQTLKGITMKKNMGNADRIIRFMVAALIAILYFTNLINGTAAVILGIIAIIFIATSFMSFCPLYLPFGISTRKKSKKV
jgi:hypothetical protein